MAAAEPPWPSLLELTRSMLCRLLPPPPHTIPLVPGSYRQAAPTQPRLERCLNSDGLEGKTAKRRLLVEPQQKEGYGIADVEGRV